jgi:hypothetical protein
MAPMSRANAVRGLSLIGAIVVCAWFAVGIRQVHDTSAATALLSSGARLSPVSAARASSLLDGAALLNPDREIGLLRAKLAAERGQRPLAQRLALGVARAEPANSQAWLLVSFVGTPSQRALAAHTLRTLIPEVH